MCVEWLDSHDPSESGWLLHCSINIPHPPFHTNATWLTYVTKSAVSMPRSFTDVERMHPADAYTAVSKHVSGKFSEAEIVRIRTISASLNLPETCFETAVYASAGCIRSTSVNERGMLTALLVT